MKKPQMVLAVLMAAYADQYTARVLNKRRIRYFKINPLNHSGKRLHRITQGYDLRVCNACPQWGHKVTHRGNTDLLALMSSIKALPWAVLLVCGKQATAAVQQLAANGKLNNYIGRIVYAKHPADRTLSNVDMDATRQQLQQILEGD